MQIVWHGLVLDGIFRSGERPSIEINKTISMIDRLVQKVRREFGSTVTMIFMLDGGYYDQWIVEYFEKENIAFILSGKIFNHVKAAVESASDDDWQEHQKGKVCWRVCELGLRSKSWSKFYRGFYTQQMCHGDGQFLLDFARPSNLILTNIGVNKKVLENMGPKEQSLWLTLDQIIKSRHGRGADELPHRALKDLIKTWRFISAWF